MINKIRKLGKTPIKAPSGNNPTPAPIAVAIPVPPYLPQGVFTIWPNNNAPILIAGTQLAYPSKTKGKVEYQKFSEKKFSSNIFKGLGLYGDDRIRTGENGFSIYRYLDDASSIKILKNSDIRIEGRIKSRSIVKNVEINNGILNFNIDNQADEYFTIVTPTSVATVKGTKFWMVTSSSGDQVFGLEGLV